MKRSNERAEIIFEILNLTQNLVRIYSDRHLSFTQIVYYCVTVAYNLGCNIQWKLLESQQSSVHVSSTVKFGIFNLQ